MRKDHPRGRFRRTPAPPQKIHRIPYSGHPLRLPRSPRKARVEGFASGHIHNHLAMKFSTLGGVTKVRRNQMEARAWYMNTLQKVAKREDGSSTVMTIHSEPMYLDYREPDEEIILDEGLDPRIIGSDSLTSPIEELEAFPVNPLEPTQELKVGEKLEEKIKDELKQFL
ncbi:Uncharacterized protein Adt_45580 [Abeliophyllum distichum]|uniref:Reverse transcriptase domain-containing protein n=1 Tax=Abeliophyllum distichum TaxID=126358 RepID=A0ABD1PE56_9LAMI